MATVVYGKKRQKHGSESNIDSFACRCFFFLTKNEARALGVIGMLYGLGLLVRSIFPPTIPLYEAIYAKEDSLFALAEQQATEQARDISRDTDSVEAQNLPLYPVHLNRASREDLIGIPRIGPATADRILALKERQGRFRSVEDLLNVRGIGEKTLEALLPYITLADSLDPVSDSTAME